LNPYLASLPSYLTHGIPQLLPDQDLQINSHASPAVLENIRHSFPTLSLSISLHNYSNIYLSTGVFCFYFFSFLWLHSHICCLLYCDSFGLYSCMYLYAIWSYDHQIE